MKTQEQREQQFNALSPDDQKVLLDACGVNGLRGEMLADWKKVIEVVTNNPDLAIVPLGQSQVTIFQKACANLSFQEVHTLLDKVQQVDPNLESLNYKNARGNTILHSLATSDHKDAKQMAILLVNKGADVLALNNKNETPSQRINNKDEVAVLPGMKEFLEEKEKIARTSLSAKAKGAQQSAPSVSTKTPIGPQKPPAFIGPVKPSSTNLPPPPKAVIGPVAPLKLPTDLPPPPPIAKDEVPKKYNAVSAEGFADLLAQAGVEQKDLAKGGKKQGLSPAAKSADLQPNPRAAAAPNKQAPQFIMDPNALKNANLKKGPNAIKDIVAAGPGASGQGTGKGGGVGGRS